VLLKDGLQHHGGKEIRCKMSIRSTTMAGQRPLDIHNRDRVGSGRVAKEFWTDCIVMIPDASLESIQSIVEEYDEGVVNRRKVRE
jgi:hypothetical protein